MGLISILVSVLPLGCSTLSKERQATHPQRTDFTVAYEECGTEAPEHPTVIIFPPTGGATRLDRMFAQKLCKKSVHVFLLTRWTGLEEESFDPELHDRSLERGLRAYETIRAGIGNRPVRLLGTSLGGLFVSAIATREDGVEKMVLIAAGGPMSEVIARSDQKGQRKLRERRKTLWGFQDEDQYEAMLGAAVSLDYMKPRFSPVFPPGVKGGPSEGPPSRVCKENILMIVGTEDSTVVTDSQRRLRKFFGEPAGYETPSGHFMTIIKSYFKYDDAIVDFLSGPVASTCGSER